MSSRFLALLLFALAGCVPDQASLEPAPEDAPVLTDPDAVLDSLVARWDAASADVSGFTLATDALVVRYARGPEGAFGIAGVEARPGAEAPPSAPPLQFLHPDRRRIAALLRGNAYLALDRSATPVLYRVTARPDYLAQTDALAQTDSLARTGPYAAPVAADAVIESGTYHLREIHTRSPLPGSSVDSALVDLRISYGAYETVDGETADGETNDSETAGGLPVPRAVTVMASGLLETFDEAELMFMRAQYQQRFGQMQSLTGEARAAEEATLDELKALLLDGTSTQTMRVDSVAVSRGDGA